MHAIQPLYVLSGFVVGVLVGVTGVGGGSLMTPLLILLFGVHPSTAVGTDLLYAAATKTGGSAIHGLNRTIDWRIVSRLAAGSVPATALTLFVLSRLALHTPASHNVITTTLGIALFFTALALIFRARLLERYGARTRALSPRRRAQLTVLTGAILGVCVSLSSVGAGAIGVTALILLYPDLPTVRIVGSDIAHAVPLTLVAGLGYWMLGAIDAPLLGSLLLGSLPGIVLGSQAASHVPETVLRPILAATLLVVGGRLLF